MILSNSIISNNSCIPWYDICKNVVIISNNFFNSSVNIFNISNNICCLNNKWRFKHLVYMIQYYASSIQLISELFLQHEQVSYHDHPSQGLSRDMTYILAMQVEIKSFLSNFQIESKGLLQPSFHQIYDEKNQHPLKYEHDV